MLRRRSFLQSFASRRFFAASPKKGKQSTSSGGSGGSKKKKQVLEREGVEGLVRIAPHAASQLVISTKDDAYPSWLKDIIPKSTHWQDVDPAVDPRRYLKLKRKALIKQKNMMMK